TLPELTIQPPLLCQKAYFAAAAYQAHHHRLFLSALEAIDASKLDSWVCFLEQLRQNRQLGIVWRDDRNVIRLHAGTDQIAHMYFDQSRFAVIAFAFAEAGQFLRSFLVFSLLRKIPTLSVKENERLARVFRVVHSGQALQKPQLHTVCSHQFGLV